MRRSGARRTVAHELRRHVSVDRVFLRRSPRSLFAEPIEKTDSLTVSLICLYEVFKKFNAAVDEAKALQAVAQMKQGHVIDVTADIALEAALLSSKHRLPMADSLIYATARREKALVWTQDDHFRGLPGVRYKDARIPRSGSKSPAPSP